MNILHSFEPVSGVDSEILVLGSMPGEESLREREYYAFKRNSFWRIAGDIFSFDPHIGYEKRLEKLIENRVALWDVLKNCERSDSLDSNIRSPEPNDIISFLNSHRGIKSILCNGSGAYRFLLGFNPEVLKLAVVEKMPSTSPAAAMFSYEEKLACYRAAFIRGFSASSISA